MSLSNPTHLQALPSASLFFILAAAFYDSLLLLAVLFLGTAVVLPWVDGATGIYLWLYRLYLIALIYIYFVWQWLHGGQTLGMKTWRLQLCAETGELTAKKASIRFGMAWVSFLLLGFGFLRALWSKQGLMWHDVVSSTKIVRLPADWYSN